ncbi:prephenate dehydrogenase [Bifidobacterium callimiconis]|uniref:Prephenate dehydrogenase n=1 Tax=Bifidobacterium callimiconis TaxID=2306973 RepID=A0A430FD08_9BIFI|nr:prephenate dehydrogenase/arogenate dehydrogenase family protein [Bifidobacterium callimiconis]RSX50681.1 prephenate dehydrogenase [Bifidobacterium callimiconis]
MGVNTEPDVLPEARVIAVAGLGLIGGSLARRLAECGRRVIAWNHRPAPYEQARAAGIECVDDVTDLARAVPDVLVLCTPLKAMPDVLAKLAPVLDSRTVLTDVGSVKGQVRDEVKAAGLNDLYVGAHPMAGNEFSGYAASDPSLYDDALWAVTFDECTSYDRLLVVIDMICEGVGDRIIAIDDDTHDQAAALISHMPHVVSTALANELAETPSRNIAQALAAGCWRDMTRVALTDPDRTRAMVEEDAANVAQLLHHMSDRLESMATLLESGDDEALAQVRDFFAVARPYREYKARERGGAAHESVTVRIGGDEASWRDQLLASAKRGEHIMHMTDRTHAIAEIRTALV